jgi:hypothetical protein
MFSDKIFGFKKLEEDKWEVKTFSFYRLFRYGMKNRFSISILPEKYKRYLKVVHTIFGLCAFALIPYGKTLHRSHDPKSSKIDIVIVIISCIYLPFINLLTKYYVRKSK